MNCPKCNGSNVVPIFYGMPAKLEVYKLRDQGKLILGGCCVTNNDPQHYCKDCKTRF